MGYHDFAGSGAIHLTGAIGALVTTYMLKPRH
jgi:Amt family ammonium transporter